MSRIVCNSGPLIALGILARLEILKSLFDEVYVPEAVEKEIASQFKKLQDAGYWIHDSIVQSALREAGGDLNGICCLLLGRSRDREYELQRSCPIFI